MLVALPPAVVDQDPGSVVRRLLSWAERQPCRRPTRSMLPRETFSVFSGPFALPPGILPDSPTEGFARQNFTQCDGYVAAKVVRRWYDSGHDATYCAVPSVLAAACFGRFLFDVWPDGFHYQLRHRLARRPFARNRDREGYRAGRSAGAGRSHRGGCFKCEASDGSA